LITNSIQVTDLKRALDNHLIINRLIV